MPKTLMMSIGLGATLSSSFLYTMGNAQKQVARLGSEIKAAETGKGSIKRFFSLRKGLESTKEQLISARNKAALLKRELQSTSKPTKALQDRMAAAGRKVHKLETRLKSQRKGMAGLKREMDGAGISTRNLSREQIRLSKAFDKAKNSRDRLNKAVLKHKKIQNDREKYRGRLMDAAALGYAAAAPVIGASRIEDTETRLSTVINAQDKDKAIAEAKASARQLAQAGLTSFADAYNIQYALNSAGLSAQASRLGATVVSKVAKITSGIPERVGEVIATTYNNLGNQLEGTTEEKMNRIGELLTKVQLKYQIRDFNQLGESMKKGAAGLSNYKVNLTQGVTALGLLNSAGLQGSEGGTAMTAVLRNLGKAQEEWNTEIVRSANGEMDLVATLGQIKEAMDDSYGDDIDARAQAIQKIFGEEGAKGFVPLINKLAEFKTGFEEVDKSSKGLLNLEIAKYAKNTSMHVAKAAGSFSVMGDAIGSILLPVVNAVISPITKVIIGATQLSEKFPVLTTATVGLGVATVGTTAATIAGSYAFTFLHGGAWNVIKVYRTIKASTIGLAIAQKASAAATMLMTTAQWALNVAMNANPIGLIITGVVALGAAGYWVWKKWEPISDFFAQLWDRLKNLLPLFQKIARFVPGGSLFNMATGAGRKKSSLNENSLKTITSKTTGGKIDLTVSPTVNVAAGMNAGDVRKAVDASMDVATGKMKTALNSLADNDRRLAFG